jgi:hypothetical protein
MSRNRPARRPRSSLSTGCRVPEVGSGVMQRAKQHDDNCCQNNSQPRLAAARRSDCPIPGKSLRHRRSGACREQDGRHDPQPFAEHVGCMTSDNRQARRRANGQITRQADEGASAPGRVTWRSQVKYRGCDEQSSRRNNQRGKLPRPFGMPRGLNGWPRSLHGQRPRARQGSRDMARRPDTRLSLDGEWRRLHAERGASGGRTFRRE